MEKVRACERTALQMKKDAQNEAKKKLEEAKLQGEKALVLTEREATDLLAASAKQDQAEAEQLLLAEETSAAADAVKLEEIASSRMKDAVALILERVGDVWQ